MQGVVRLRISWKPVFAVNLLSPGGELGEQVLAVFLFADVRYRLSVGLHNLKIAIVDPDAALEVTLFPFNLLGGNVENIAMKVIFLLLADIENAVLVDIVAGQHKRQP